MRLQHVMVAGIGVVLAVATIGCGGEEPSKIEVTARDLSYAPGEMRMQHGRAYEVHMKNEGQLLHDWNIDSMPASGMSVHETGKHDMTGMPTPSAGTMRMHMAAEHGTTSMMTFTPTQAGEYTYYCSVPGHREAGMQGRLVVE